MKKETRDSFFKYLHVTPKEERWGLYVTSIGYSRIDPHEHYPKFEHPASHELNWNRGRTLNDFTLVLISKGEGTFCSARTEPRQVEEGNCFFLFPGVWHRYRPDSRQGWEEYWISFHGFQAEQLMSNGFFSADKPCIQTGLDKDLVVLFGRMMDCVKAGLLGYSQQISGILLQILGLVNTISESKQLDHSPVEKLISKSRFLLHESQERAMDMMELAQQLPMGYSAFRKQFKLFTGQSPNQYHLNLRMDRAKELLESTILSIEEVSVQTGFESIYYFSKLFKRKTGVSPNAYRKRVQHDMLHYAHG